MAQAGVVIKGSRKMIFETKLDTKKAMLLTFVAFLFGGFQCAIFGMLTVSVSKHFGISASMIVFFDSFGLWGQIIAMAIGGFIISKIKGKNTLLLAGIIMIVGSTVAIFSPNIYLYTSMSFLSNMAIGFILVSCNYMIMGTVTEEGKSAGPLSILNIFFSGGFMLCPVIIGFIIAQFEWQGVFALIAVLFVIFIIFLLLLNVHELIDDGKALKDENKKKPKSEKESFLTLPLILTAIAFFLLVYVEQIINYFNQPYMMENLHFNVQTVGAIVSTYAACQLIGRGVFGKFLLPNVKLHKYIITAAFIYCIIMIAFMQISTVAAAFIVIACLGFADSCMYPSLLGHGLDQIGKVSPGATSFMVTIGSLGIPIGTMMCGLIGEHFGKPAAMYLGPVCLILIAVLIIIVRIIHGPGPKTATVN